MNYRPSFCIVNTVLILLFRQVRILYLAKTAKIKLTIQGKVLDNSFRFDVSTHSTATLYSSTHKHTARQLVQDRREHTLYGNTVLFQSETNFFLRKTKEQKKKKSFEKLCGQTPKRLFVWFSLGKIGLR